ncbi:MAG TPA: acyltransferase family protein [Xanthobacteraceae bacterium]|nr:acyltransferase family protein [Xanthobacteraceae bacterium]
MPPSAPSVRVDWVDLAKGFCIVFVVMMHSTLGVEEAAGRTGFMTHVVAFARPFRMPDFFLISGLFLSRVIDRDWRSYLDRKVLHFAYFYLLWTAIQFAAKAPGLAAEHGPAGVVQLYALSFIEPFGTLWFIYLLPVFFVVTRLLRPVPMYIVLPAAALLQMANIETGWIVPDEFAARFVYFYAGYVFAPLAFRLAASVQQAPGLALAALLVWALVNGALVVTGLAPLPGVGLALGFAGASAVIALSALMASSGRFGWLEYAGRNSLAIYLAFFLPMAATRAVLLKTGIIDDIGVVSLIVTAAAVIAPLILQALVRGTRARFLFERPRRLRLERGPALQPAQ